MENDYSYGAFIASIVLVCAIGYLVYLKNYEDVIPNIYIQEQCAINTVPVERKM